MNKNWIAVPVLGLALATAGCGRMHAGAAANATASGSAAAHAVATSSAGIVGKQIIKACVPQNGIAQARWFEYMAAGKNSKHAQQGVATREAFAACAGIPRSRMGAFETQAGNDAEAAAKGAVKAARSPNVTLKQAVKQATETYLGTTLPEDVVKYRG